MTTTPRRFRPRPSIARGAPTTTTAPNRPVRRIHWERLPLALFGFFILGLWWAAGGKWTIDGTPMLLNVIFAFFRVRIELPLVSHWAAYALLCWLPILISYAEHNYAPWRGLRRYGILVGIFVIGIWLIVTAADWSSTWLAITHPDTDAWPIAHQLAALPPLAAIWTTLTTFAPEVGFAVLTWWLWE